MTYAERAYFESEPCLHIAAYHEALRLRRIERRSRDVTLRHRLNVFLGSY